MPYEITVKVQGTQDGDTAVQTFTASGDGREQAKPTVPAAKGGTLTTRTDNDTGTFTMENGHGFITSDKIDVFWAAGKRRNMTATVTGNSVVLDGGTGDNLPAATTAIRAMKPYQVDYTVAGDDVVGIQAKSPVAGYIVVVEDDEGPVDGKTFDFLGNSGFAWCEPMEAAIGYTNPLDGMATLSVKFSHGASSAQEMSLTTIY